MKKLLAFLFVVIAPCCCGSRSIGTFELWNHLSNILNWFHTCEGINYVILLALSSIIQGNTLQLMGVNDFLRYALSNQGESLSASHTNIARETLFSCETGGWTRTKYWFFPNINSKKILKKLKKKKQNWGGNTWEHTFLI